METETYSQDTSHIFLMVQGDMLWSKAYATLPPSAAKILFLFLAKVQYPYKETKHYTTEFKFPYSEAKRYGIGPKTFYNSIQRLKRHGFIEQTQKGWVRGTFKAESMYKLSDRWRYFEILTSPRTDEPAVTSPGNSSGDHHPQGEAVNF